MRILKCNLIKLKTAGKEVVVRTCLTADALLSLPIFLLLIWVSPDKYAATLAASGETINRRIMEYRR